MTTPRRAILCLAGLASLLAADCGDSAPQGCGTETCSTAVWIHIPIAEAASILDQAKVAACRNDECHDWQLPSLPEGGEEAFPSAPFLTGTLWLNPDQSITLDIQWTFEPSPGDIDAGTALADGDHYVVILTTSAGLASILLDRTATYHPYLPNGPDCPPECTQAELSP
jgi:hypothetical protein